MKGSFLKQEYLNKKMSISAKNQRKKKKQKAHEEVRTQPLSGGAGHWYYQGQKHFL